MAQVYSSASSRISRRLFTAAALALGAASLLQAQIPGRNVNMVTGTTFPGGDPWLQKQNEPSVAISTRNPCTLLGGANDYRAVNVPGLPEDKETGDAWLGLYKSTDCGQTWFSTLVPGYPQDTTAEGQASPVKGLSTGADPTVRSGPSGLFFYSFIAFNRGSNVGKFALARYVDNNNREGGDPIQYLGTTEIDKGSAGQFLDKPHMAVTKGTGTCSINGATVPASVVHLAWTVFVGNSEDNIRTKLYYARSSNCGASLDAPPTKLTEGWPINQGAVIAASPVNNNVFAIWRQFASDRTNNALLIARSADGGRTFTKAEPISYFNGFRPFDQGTTSRTFRTNAFPTATVDHTGRLHLAISVRGYTSNPDEARIVHLSSTDGITWTMPQTLDPDPTPGHQIMPALTYAAGRLHAVWYDLREDEAVKAFATAFEPFVREVFAVRHTLDVRGATSPIAADGTVAFQPYGVLQLPGNTQPRVSRYLLGDYGGTAGLRQLQYNRPNLKLYAGGTRPFIGDYIDVAGLPFVGVRSQGVQQWLPNDGSVAGGGAQTFHAVWADNRDAKVGPATAEPANMDGATLGYGAPGTAACVPGTPSAAMATSRNANVYTARITPGLFLAVPGNAKPTTCASCTNGMIQRAFAVFVQNTTGTLRTFRLTIGSQPSDAPVGTATFTQFPASPIAAGDTQVDVTVAPRSSAARTVYVTSAEKYPYVQVNAVEQSTPAGQAPLSASAILNPDIQNPDIQNPDIQNPDIQNPDIQNTEIHNPDIENPDIQNPDIQNPDIENPDIENPDIQNPDIENPDIQNPDIQNPDIENPDIENPDIENPDIENGSITDVSFDVTNNGNTTSSYQVKVNVDGSTSGYLFQLIGRRVYKTPTAVNCQPAEAAHNQILFNIVNPVLTGGLLDPNSSDVQNATLLLQPGETVKITLRAWDKDVLTGPGAPANDGIAPFCPMLGALCTAITHNVALTVQAQAANNVNGVIAAQPVAVTTATAPGFSPIGITTAALPGGLVGLPYGPAQQQIQGGTAPYSWSVSSGVLPAGLGLDTATGAISGMPTTPGTSTFTLRVQDAQGYAATQAFSVRTMGINTGDVIVTDGVVNTTSGSVFRITPDGATTELIASIAGRPQDVAADAAGRLIVVDSTNDAVLRVTPDRVETLFTGSPLAGPIAVAVDAAGYIIVGDNVTDTVYRLAPDGSSITALANLPPSSSELQNIDIVLDPSDDLIVADDGGASVTLLRIAPSGAVSTILADSTTITRVGGLGVNGAGDFVVADFSQNRIYTVTPAGFVHEAWQDVSALGSNITALAVDVDDSYVIPVNFTATVWRVSATATQTIKSGAPLAYPTSALLYRPAITFEQYPDGTPACASCPVTSEFAPLGVTFSFQTTLVTGLTNAQLVGPGGSDRPSEPGNHSVTAPAAPPPNGGFYNGVLTMTLAGAPQTVVFRARGNDSATFPVDARDANGNAIPAGQIQRRNVFKYTGLGMYLSRQETVVITSPAGVGAVDVGMPSALVFVDNLTKK